MHSFDTSFSFNLMQAVVFLIKMFRHTYYLAKRSNYLKVLFRLNQADDISNVGEICRFVQSTSKILFLWNSIYFFVQLYISLISFLQ